MSLFPSKRQSATLMVAVFLISWIHPLWPMDQALHSSLTLIGFGVMWWYDRQYDMERRAFFLISLFMIMHSIAAHWLYSNIPYDAWMQALTGWSPDAFFGWHRNMFDRLVHLMYGLCFTPAVAEYAARRGVRLPRHSFLIALAAVMCSSLVYEWMEWLIAITMSPEQAEAYNGQQGDPWDAHKDMLLATIGSVLWTGAYWNKPLNPASS